MIALVDTPIWSLALRRKEKNSSEQVYCDELSQLIRETRAGLIGVIQQELLSGIRDKKQFELLRTYLRGMDSIPIEISDYEQAARNSNTCRKNGIQGSPADFLLCAVAMRLNASIFTTGRDFTSYAKYIDISLHQLRHS